MAASGRSDFIEEAGGGGWKILLGAFLGSALSVSAVPFYSLGVLAGPIATEFGWSRGAIQASLAFSMIGMVLAAVPTGWLTDRYGARPMAAIGLALLAVILVLLGVAGPNLTIWYGLWVAMSLVGSGSTAITWTRGVSDWFVKSRGLALGLTLMGNGFTAVVAPPLVTALVAAYGWRAAYFVLAAAVILLGLIPTLLFFRERPAPRAKAHEELPGLTLRQAVGGYRMWLISIAFVFLSFGIAGSIPNLVPLITDRGFSAMEAAGFASLIGISVIVGRVGTGWLLDRFWAPGVAAAILLLPIGGCLLLASPDVGPALIGFAVIAIGLTAGMEFDMMGFLCARYFGFRNYGKIFAAPWIGFALGAAVGAAAFGRIRDVTGSYVPVLLVTAGTFTVAALLLLALGRYPRFDTVEKEG